MGIVGTSDINKLNFFCQNSVYSVNKIYPNTVVGLINIKGTVVICLLAFAVFLL